MTQAHAGFTGVVQLDWPRPRAWARPERLDAGIETLPGVGPALAKRLRALGLETVRDLLHHRPRRYESAVDEVAITQLWGDERGRDRGRGRRRANAPARRAPLDRDGGGQGLERHDRRFVVQPALARRQADARDAPAAARQARAPRLRREELRRGCAQRDRRLRAGLSGERAGAVDEAPRARSSRARRARTRPARSAAGGARAAVAPRRARRAALSARRAGRRARATPSRPRRAARPAARRRPLAHRRRRRFVARDAGRARQPLSRGAAVRVHRASGIGDPRDRRRPRTDGADAATAPGRRRLGQDRRRALRAAARGRERPAGRAHGADRDARRAAFPDARAALRAARRALRAAHGLRRLEEDPRRDRERRRADRGRHARADPAGRGVRRSRRRRRRRAASLRRRPADRHSQKAGRRTSCT